MGRIGGAIGGARKDFNGVFVVGPAMGGSYYLVGGVGSCTRLWSELGEDHA